MTTLLLMMGCIIGLAQCSPIYNPLGELFYVSKYSLETDVLTGGVPLLADLSTSCYIKSKLEESNTEMTQYSNTEALYSAIATDSGLDLDIMTTDFTLGTSLDVMTKSVDGGRREVSGMTLKKYIFQQQVVLDRQCIINASLSSSLRSNFENLNASISKPELKSSWSNYDTFLKIFGSHFVDKVTYGSAIY